MRVVGGREIHPVNVRVGGFYRAPTRARARRRAVRAARGAPASSPREAVAWTAALPFPDFEEDFDFVALRDADALRDRGRPAGLERRASTSRPPEFDEHVVEEQVPHSTALHSRLRDGTRYLVGPLARYALNGDRLSPGARAAAGEAGLEPVVPQPVPRIVVRCVEILYARRRGARG